MSAIDHPTRIKPGHKNIASTTLHVSVKPQAGFIQGVLLFGIALLAVVIAAFSFSNRGSSNSTATEEAKVYASTIIAHGSQIKDAAQRFKADRGDLVYMHFLDTDTNGNALFNRTDNYIAPLTVQTKAYTSPPPDNSVTTLKNGPYYYLKGTIGGVTARITTTGPLQKATCQRLNLTLHGALFAGDPPVATTGAATAFQPTGTTAAPAAGTKQLTEPATITIPTFSGVTNLSEGCVASTDTKYYFFKILDTDFTSGNN